MLYHIIIQFTLYYDMLLFMVCYVVLYPVMRGYDRPSGVQALAQLKRQLLFIVSTNQLLSAVQDAGQNISAIQYYGFQSGNASIPTMPTGPALSPAGVHPPSHVFHMAPMCLKHLIMR
jgi:hypothetical protein